MAITSHPATGPSHRSPAPDAPPSEGLEALGVRPAALIAALLAGGVAWFVLLRVLDWVV